MSPDPKPTEIVLIERMERIERENRRLRRSGTTMLIGMAIVLGITVTVFIYSGSFGAGVSRNIAARQFTIRDEKGTSRGTWGIADDGTVRFILSDQSGHPRVRVSLFADGSSGVSLADSADRKLVVLGATATFPEVARAVKALPVPRAVLGMSPNGSANLVFADRDGATKAGLGVDARGQGSFTLADRGLSQPAAEPEADTTEDPADSQPPRPPKPTPSAARKK